MLTAVEVTVAVSAVVIVTTQFSNNGNDSRSDSSRDRKSDRNDGSDIMGENGSYRGSIYDSSSGLDSVRLNLSHQQCITTMGQAVVVVSSAYRPVM